MTAARTASPPPLRGVGRSGTQSGSTAADAVGRSGTQSGKQSKNRHDAYRAGLCIDCKTVRYSAGRPRCNDCHATHIRELDR